MDAIVKTQLVHPGDVEALWPIIEPMISKAIDRCHGETSAEYVKQDLIDGADRLLLVTEDENPLAAIMLSISQRPTKKVLHVSLAGGEQMEKWFDAGIPVVERVAQEVGADAVYVMGRKGWIRKLEKHGYSVYSTLIGKELKE